jgi:hypothetical protein
MRYRAITRSLRLVVVELCGLFAAFEVLVRFHNRALAALIVLFLVLYGLNATAVTKHSTQGSVEWPILRKLIDFFSRRSDIPEQAHTLNSPSFEDNQDRVDCTVFAPPIVSPNDTFLVQVFAHREQDAHRAATLATQFDQTVESRGYKTLGTNVPYGSQLSLHLLIPGLRVEPAVDHLEWYGSPSAAQFEVTVPPDRLNGSVVATVTISLEHVPIGHLKFKLDIAARRENKASVESEQIDHVSHFYQRAFISYASADRAEVLKRVQMLARLRVKYFQDLLSLEPGERWERALYRHIDESDLFLLFWSTAAKESKWVMEEVRYAISRKGSDESAPPEILPVIIEGPPPVAPPNELAHLHFNDYLLYLIPPQHSHDI